MNARPRFPRDGAQGGSGAHQCVHQRCGAGASTRDPRRGTFGLGLVGERVGDDVTHVRDVAAAAQSGQRPVQRVQDHEVAEA